MTALDKAFIKAYAPTRRPHLTQTADAIALEVPAPAASEPPVTAGSTVAQAIAHPAQVERRLRANGHAASPLPAPHAVFRGPARRQTFRPEPSTAAESVKPDADTSSVPPGYENPLAEAELSLAAIQDPPPAKQGRTKKAKSPKADKRSKPDAVSEEGLEPEAAEGSVHSRKRDESEPADASAPAKRKGSKTYKLKIAERAERIDGLAVEAELPTAIAAAAEVVTPPAPPESQPDDAPQSPAVAAQQVGRPEAASVKPGALSERRPLSEFVKPLPVEDAFHPHLEVDYLLWTTTVRSLVERGGTALENFATQLTTQAGNGEKVLALSGAARGEGRTSVLLAVARQIAQRGGRVVIVDADFEKPDLARCVGLSPEFGWDQVLQGDLPLEEVLITSLQDRLAIVPWHQRLPAGATPFDTLRANVSLGMLRDHYDLVLVDGGPLSTSDKPNGLASLVKAAHFDGGYLISDRRPRTAGKLGESLVQARQMGLRIFGAIENFSPLAAEASEPHRAAA